MALNECTSAQTKYAYSRVTQASCLLLYKYTRHASKSALWMQSVHVKQRASSVFAIFRRILEMPRTQTFDGNANVLIPESIFIAAVFRGIFYCIAKVQTSSSRENVRGISSPFSNTVKCAANNVNSPVNEWEFTHISSFCLSSCLFCHFGSNFLSLPLIFPTLMNFITITMAFAIMKWKCLIYISWDYSVCVCVNCNNISGG